MHVACVNGNGLLLVNGFANEKGEQKVCSVKSLLKISVKTFTENTKCHIWKTGLFIKFLLPKSSLQTIAKNTIKIPPKAVNLPSDSVLNS